MDRPMDSRAFSVDSIFVSVLARPNVERRVNYTAYLAS